MPDKTYALKSLPDGMVTKKQLDALSANFFSKVQLTDNGKLRPIDCSNPNHPEKSDTRAVVFQKKDVEALFAANPGCDGLKIYFGIHDHAILPIPEENRKRYQNKLMAVLVTTTGLLDNINNDATVAAKGLDNGMMCPPLTGC